MLCRKYILCWAINEIFHLVHTNHLATFVPNLMVRFPVHRGNHFANRLRTNELRSKCTSKHQILLFTLKYYRFLVVHQQSCVGCLHVVAHQTSGIAFIETTLFFLSTLTVGLLCALAFTQQQFRIFLNFLCRHYVAELRPPFFSCPWCPCSSLYISTDEKDGWVDVMGQN